MQLWTRQEQRYLRSQTELEQSYLAGTSPDMSIFRRESLPPCCYYRASLIGGGWLEIVKREELRNTSWDFASAGEPNLVAFATLAQSIKFIARFKFRP